MKSLKLIVASVVLAIFACLSATACNNVSKDVYDDLNARYNQAIEEKDELEKISKWLELYNSIEIGKSFTEISEMFDFKWARRDGVTYSYEDGSTDEMEAYTWKNKDLFDIYHTAENQIVVVFNNGVSIYKQYGKQGFAFDYGGTVSFPSPKKVD